MQEEAMDPSPAAPSTPSSTPSTPRTTPSSGPRTSHLKTLDIPTLAAFEADVVTGFARQAGGLDEYVRDHGDDLPKGQAR